MEKSSHEEESSRAEEKGSSGGKEGTQKITTPSSLLVFSLAILTIEALNIGLLYIPRLQKRRRNGETYQVGRELF